MDIFRQGRGDNADFTLKPAIPGLRHIVIGVARRLSSALSFVFRRAHHAH